MIQNDGPVTNSDNGKWSISYPKNPFDQDLWDWTYPKYPVNPGLPGPAVNPKLTPTGTNTGTFTLPSSKKDKEMKIEKVQNGFIVSLGDKKMVISGDSVEHTVIAGIYEGLNNE